MLNVHNVQRDLGQVKHPGPATYPAWAAYQSNETGTEEVYVRSFPVAGQQIPISEGGGQFPRWSPDGRTIYYWRAENAAVDTLYAARVTTQPTLAVVSRAPVITGSYLAEDWDLHPDGDRIVVVEASAAQAPQGDFLVVVNWFEELRARLGR